MLPDACPLGRCDFPRSHTCPSGEPFYPELLVLSTWLPPSVPSDLPSAHLVAQPSLSPESAPPSLLLGSSPFVT